MLNSTSPSSNFTPFFPSYNSTPTPPLSGDGGATSLPVLPSSIPSVDSPHRHYRSKVAAFASMALIALAILVLAVIVILALRRRIRRRRAGGVDERSDRLRFFPADATSSDGRKLSAASAATAGSEFLYLGTLVSTHGRNSANSAAPGPAGSVGRGVGSPYLRIESPELRPLPPLRHHYRNGAASLYEVKGSSKMTSLSVKASADSVDDDRSRI